MSVFYHDGLPAVDVVAVVASFVDHTEDLVRNVYLEADQLYIVVAAAAAGLYVYCIHPEPHCCCFHHLYYSLFDYYCSSDLTFLPSHLH